MLKAIISKLKVQIKIANKKYPFERFHPHHNSGRIPPGGGGVLKKYLGVGCAPETLEPLAFKLADLIFYIYIFFEWQFPVSLLYTKISNQLISFLENDTLF